MRNKQNHCTDSELENVILNTYNTLIPNKNIMKSIQTVVLSMEPKRLGKVTPACKFSD